MYSNYDYEIRGYVVEWWIGGDKYKKGGFGTEESAAKFAKEMLKNAVEV